MADKKSNTDHLHEEGVVNKDELHPDQIEAIDALSDEEVEQLKKVSKKVDANKSGGVGIYL